MTEPAHISHCSDEATSHSKMERNPKRHSVAAMFRRAVRNASSTPWHIKEPPVSCDTNEARRLHYKAEAEAALQNTLQTHINRLYEDTSLSDGNSSLSLSERLQRCEDANRMLTRPMASERLRIYRDGENSVDTTLQAEFDEFRNLIDVEEAELQDLFRDLDEVNQEIAETTNQIEIELAKSELTEDPGYAKEIKAIEKEISELGQNEIKQLESEENKRRKKQKVIFETLAELAD